MLVLIPTVLLSYLLSTFHRYSLIRQTQFDLLISTIFPQYNVPCSVSFTVNDVNYALNFFRDIQSIGPDGIQGDFLFKFKDVIAGPLFTLFQKFLSAGIFPSLLKFGSITPMFKSGNPTLVSNYHLITLLSHTSKLFEIIVLNSICPTLNHIISDEQHDFIFGCSTTICNFVFSCFICGSFCERSEIDTIYADFSKVFDWIEHSFVLQSFDFLGIDDPLLS